MRKIFDIIVFMVGLLLVMAAAGCGSRDGRLPEIDALAEVDAAGALAALDSIEVGGLGKSDRMLYELIRLKAQDKAYMRQASDSVARMLAEYFRGSGREGEALYYCGRINCDLGDYPTALRYFNEAESTLEKQGNSGNLYLSVLSQKGRLLDRLGLTGEAIDYGKRTIELSRRIGDTVNLHYDHELLAQMYLHSGELDSAESEIEKAFKVRPLPKEELAFLKITQSLIANKKGNNVLALNLIRGVAETVDSDCRNSALAAAAHIYQSAGKADSAMIYARLLKADRYNDNEVTVYRILLSPEVSKSLPEDSLLEYTSNYRIALENRFNEREAKAAMLQNSMYKYLKSEQQYARVIEQRNQFLTYIIILVCLLFILGGIILIQNNRRIRQTLRMQEIVLLFNNKKQRKQKELAVASNQAYEQTAEEMSHATPPIINEFCEDFPQENTHSGKTASFEIRHSASSQRKLILKMLANNIVLEDECEYWGKIEKSVNEDITDFRNKLEELAQSPLSEKYYRLALLIRCGATPTEVSILISKSKSTITDRRRELCKKLFGGEGNLKAFDKLLRQIQ